MAVEKQFLKSLAGILDTENIIEFNINNLNKNNYNSFFPHCFYLSMIFLTYLVVIGG